MNLPVFLLGAAMTTFAGVSVYSYLKNEGDIRKTLRNALYESGVYHERRNRDGSRTLQECVVTACYREKWGFDITIELPVGLPASKVRNAIETLEMALDGEIIIESDARYVRLKIGKMPLNDVMNFNDKLLLEAAPDGGIRIPLYSRFGIEWIDFNTEGGAHMLIAGATGMGKSKLLDLIITLLVLCTDGSARIIVINNKAVDAMKYRGIAGITVHDEINDSLDQIELVRQSLEERKSIMISHNVTNVSELPEPLPPIYVVIDEYARFSEFKDFQNAVVEIAELGRSFDIHLVIATQRPDAAEVLNPRIKANCLTKLAFKTTTASNSRIILETDDAVHLPLIQGRGIVQRTTNNRVQVPYLSDEQQSVLLKLYRMELEQIELPIAVGGDKQQSKQSSKREKKQRKSEGKIRYLRDTDSDGV